MAVATDNGAQCGCGKDPWSFGLGLAERGLRVCLCPINFRSREHQGRSRIFCKGTHRQFQDAHSFGSISPERAEKVPIGSVM